jgi:pyruvate/2-oxoglutarate dehydrogenase complex dihydrolipoamide acyltransferase (E2) component
MRDAVTSIRRSANWAARDEEVFGLAEERGRGTGMDPVELWKQWFEAGSRVWTDVLRGSQEGYMDPYGLYRQWFEGMESMRVRMMSAPVTSGADSSEGVDPRELWRKWFDATAESWEKSAELGQEMLGVTPRWIEMLDQAQTNLMSVGSFPKDPLEFAVQWYNATSGPFSEFVHDVLEQEKFLESASRWMQSYASFYKVFRQRSEEYLKNLQLPVRSDITRVAGLVVALEDKIDRIEEAFEVFEYGYAKPAAAEQVVELEKRLDRVEGKLDRLLAALESGSPNGSPVVNATDAARSEARELGVDLTEVEGTGDGGQITVEDVRRKGEG